MKWIQVSSNEEPLNSHKVYNVLFSSLNQRYDINRTILWNVPTFQMREKYCYLVDFIKTITRLNSMN